MNERIKVIDGLRGIFAIIVVISHFMVAFFPASYWGNKFESRMSYGIDVYLSQAPFSLFYAGNFAVCLFMMITGLVLSRIVYKNKNIKKIIITRYFRLCIPVLFSTIIIFLFMKLSLFNCKEVANITGSQWLANKYTFEPTIKDMLLTTIFNVFFVGAGKYNTVLWMMSILFYGSFLTIIISKIFKDNKYRYIIYIIFILLFYKIDSIYYIAFILGILVTDISEKHKNIIDKLNNTIIISLLVILGIYLASYPTGYAPTNVWYSFLEFKKHSYEVYHVVGALIIIITILCSSYIQKLLEKNILLYLGRISFSIYLTHIIILCSFSCSIFNKIYGITQRYQISFIITFILSFIIIIGLAHLFNIIVEQNSKKIISKIYNKFFI